MSRTNSKNRVRQLNLNKARSILLKRKFDKKLIADNKPQSCQNGVKKCHNSTQTTFFSSNNFLNIVNTNFDLDNVSDLLSIFIDSCGFFNSINLRILSVIIYLILRIVGIPFNDIRQILKKLRLLEIQTCHEWALTIIDENDLCVILRDARGKHKHSNFYAELPDLEKEAKAFAIANTSAKKCSFCVKDLAKFIDKRFRELYPNLITDYYNDKLIRSEESCRTDLLKWGAKFDKNKNRPYFEGHERQDVVASRNSFIEKLLSLKNFYFSPYKDGNANLVWNKPKTNKRILISHDETTVRSGEVPMFRWIFEFVASFFNKGRGRSIMLSMFMVQHDSTEIFELNEKEWKEALKNHPELDDEDELINYYPRSANAWIEPKKDNYFTNDVILKQFERLFILLKYKNEFKNCKFDVLVDNARTHSAKIYDVAHFNKFPGTNCVYDKIEWVENNVNKRYL